MKKWLQSLLGIDLVLTNLHDMRENRLSDRRLLNRLEDELRGYKMNNAIAHRALGRLVAKIDSAYSRDYADPQHIAESDEIAERVLKQIAGEVKESNRP